MNFAIMMVILGSLLGDGVINPFGSPVRSGGWGEGVRKGAAQILLSSSSIMINESPLTRHSGIKPTKRREGVDKRLSAVDTLIPFVVQKRVRRGTSIAQRKQLLQQRTLFTTRANTLKPLPPFIQPFGDRASDWVRVGSNCTMG